MKIKKAKIFKKTLNFFKINFGFFEPFHLIIDGNFLSIILEKNLDIKGKRQTFFLQKTKSVQTFPNTDV